MRTAAYWAKEDTHPLWLYGASLPPSFSPAVPTGHRDEPSRVAAVSRLLQAPPLPLKVAPNHVNLYAWPCVGYVGC